VPGAFMNGATLGAILLRIRVRKLVKRYSRRYNAVTPRRDQTSEGRSDFVLALLRGDAEVAKRAGYDRLRGAQPERVVVG